MITVRLESSELRNRLQALMRMTERPRSLLQAAARGVRKLLQQHFKMRDQTPNQLGGKRTHFWLDVYKSTQLGEVTDSYAVVGIGDARFGGKLHDNTITPGKGISSKTGAPTRNLSIPVDPEAYGRRPAVFESETGLKLIPLSIGGRIGALGTSGGVGRLLVVRYILVKRVFVPRDPNALPADQAMEAAAGDAAQAQLNSQIQGGAV